jgi:hypothetical protein
LGNGIRGNYKIIRDLISFFFPLAINFSKNGLNKSFGKLILPDGSGVGFKIKKIK